MTDLGLRWVEIPGEGTGLLIPAPIRPEDEPVAVCTDSAIADVLSGRAGIAGSFVRSDDGMLFRPRFPFRDGRDYAVVGGGRVIGRLHLAADAADTATPTTRVLAIHPTTAVLAENHLRFGVQFSGPMSRGLSWRHIHLFRDGDREPLEDAILPDELWDRTGTRLTLLLEPGRIKRGLVPNAEGGTAIRNGVRYRLVIDEDFPDAAGRPLVVGAEHSYLGGPAVRAVIDPAQWSIEASQDRVRVRFERALDHALVLSCLSLEGDRAAIRGMAAVHESELGWTFVPDDPLPPGEYALVIQPRLQDGAGNSLHRVFDRDVERDQASAAQVVRLPVVIG